MFVEPDTVILYAIRDKNGEIIHIPFTFEQVEGSVPNFYQQLKRAIIEAELEDFDVDSSEIIKREVLNRNK